MPQIRVPAAYYRGGTSRAVIFREEDLAQYDDEARDAIILAALGSPDPYGRELDGLGGGISSLSKAAIVGPAPAGSGADVTFKFAQVAVERPAGPPSPPSAQPGRLGPLRRWAPGPS